MTNVTSQDIKKINLPDSPGVYLFKKGKQILYIGKATSLRDRVRSYFSSDLIQTRGGRIVNMVVEADKIAFKKTDSVLEALILEAALIKKNQPPYNVKEKDDKSFNYVIITNEDFPRILVVRERDLLKDAINFKIKYKFGPFLYGSQLKEAMKIVRRLFPYRDKCMPNQNRPCFNRQLGLCPGVCTGEISKKEYAKTIKHIALFFAGKKKTLITTLKKEMMIAAKAQRFENAELVKRQMFALEHIHDVSLLKNESISDNLQHQTVYRIEAYDIAHISGTNTVGVMTVVENGELKKSDYRKFKIKGSAKNMINDVANLKETLRRRLGHAEWPLPNLIVVDGSVAQMNAANTVLKERGFNIEVVAVVKNEKHKASEVMGKKWIINKWQRSIILVNAEAHRFAVGYHRKLRSRLLK